MPKLPLGSPAVATPFIGRVDVLLARAAKAERDGGLDEAIRLYRGVLSIDPTCLQAINRLGAVSGQNGDLATALRQFENSLRIDPNQPEAWFNLSVARSKLGLTQQALASCDRAIALSPRSAMAHMERGAILSRLGRHAEALAAFDETVRLLPDSALAAGHRGWTLQWCERYDEAFSEYDRAIASRPDFAEAWVSKAMLYLLLGDLTRGFELFEWRWRLPGVAAESPDVAGGSGSRSWRGEPDIAGKTLLVSGEQGHGDALQFCRYAPLAANAGARVIVRVQPELVRLMATLDGVSEVVSDRDPPPEFDFHCPMMSLPLAFGTTLETIPSAHYLRADPALVAEWRARLSKLEGVRVGLVWAGGSRFGDPELMATDQRRSMPLAGLAPLTAVDGCSFVSLQIGPPAAQAKSPPPGLVLHDLTGAIRDYMDTAALLENLDLVIAVDTSVTHLAGAMGKPIWMLNRFDTCWRWLLNRNDSPWYPTLRQFRQSEPGDWAPVMRSVADAQREFVSDRTAGGTTR